MTRKSPNSICKTCWRLSMKYSNDTCAADLGDGTRCKAALHGLLDGELIKCATCTGVGKIDSTRCPACDGYGLEYVKS